MFFFGNIVCSGVLEHHDADGLCHHMVVVRLAAHSDHAAFFRHEPSEGQHFRSQLLVTGGDVAVSHDTPHGGDGECFGLFGCQPAQLFGTDLATPIINPTVIQLRVAKLFRYE